jgi:hypothetical protein
MKALLVYRGLLAILSLQLLIVTMLGDGLITGYIVEGAKEINEELARECKRLREQQ